MQKNAIVMMFDTLQYNYVGCYGNSWIQTPNMDRLGREGTIFENSYTEGLPTIPCRRAMHTGRFTLPYSGWTPLSMEDTTIADLCWGRPIDTAFIFDSAPHRLPKFGFTRAFDKVWFIHGHEADHYYYDNEELIHLKIEDYYEESSYQGYLNKRGGVITNRTATEEIVAFLKARQHGGEKEENRYVAKTITKAIEYLGQVDRNKQFFLWVDSFDPHEPWDPPSVYNPDIPSTRYDPDYTGKDEFLPFPDLVEGIYTEPQLHHIRMLYAELVTLCDKYLGKLLDAVRDLGFEENTLFMMVSDHGQPLGNGEHGHGLMRKLRPWPYEELAHTPLIVRCPGTKPGQRNKSYVQSCDVAPTVCDWLGIGIHPDMQGHSLLPMMRGEVEKVRDFAVAGYHGYSWSIINDDWSYIHWIKEATSTKDLLANFYGASAAESSAHLKGSGKSNFFGNEDKKIAVPKEKEEDVQKRYKEAATLDGADQWTCTPGSSTEVPEKDELYDRKNDPYQLNNLIETHPEAAKMMYDMLREFMTEMTLMK